MVEALDVYLTGRHAGRLTSEHTEVRFDYIEEYRFDRLTPALSVSIPKSQPHHDSVAVAHWIDNLLPDNENVRERWGNDFGLRRVTPFGLLRHMGVDCAGAVQLVPEGVDPSRDSELRPVSVAEIETHLRALRQDDSAWTFKDSGGRWSLGGQQGKFALARNGDGWSEPSGRAPSTHIFKVGIEQFAHGDAAEYVTMRAAWHLGLLVARTEIARFGEQTAVVVERFDRYTDSAGHVERLHQEDLCQAFGISRARKYQSDGGPNVSDVGTLIESHVDPRDRNDSREMFGKALIFNWLAAGTDAHAKNFALLHLGPRVRMAPLYDLTSAALLVSPSEVQHEGKLAMKLGSEYRLKAIGQSQIIQAAHDLRVAPEWLSSLADDYARRLPDAIDHAIADGGDAIEETTGNLFRDHIAKRLARTATTVSYLKSITGAEPKPEQAERASHHSAGTRVHAVSDQIWVAEHARAGRVVPGHWRKRPGQR